jgi:hypothetical protein
MKDRRGQQRCVKDVSMYCTLLHGHTARPVTIHNYNASGLYFETSVKILAGTYIVLRSIGANEQLDQDVKSKAPIFSMKRNDPEVCTLFRSHCIAKVKRCVALGHRDNAPYYGVGAQIEMLTD